METLRLLPSMETDRRAVAELHHHELPDSALAELGADVLYRTYYGDLLNQPGYFCYIYKVDGAVAGFAAFSTDCGKVFREAVKRHWPLLFGAFAKRLLKDPAGIKKLWKLAGSAVSMEREPFAEIKAEAMSTAVAAPYRSVEFFKRTGLHVSRSLYLTMARVLYANGIRTVKGFTRKSNVRVNASLGSLGWKKVYEGYKTRGAVVEPTCLWTWDLEAAIKRWGPQNGAVQ